MLQREKESFYKEKEDLSACLLEQEKNQEGRLSLPQHHTVTAVPPSFLVFLPLGASRMSSFPLSVRVCRTRTSGRVSGDRSSSGGGGRGEEKVSGSPERVHQTGAEIRQPEGDEPAH